METVGDYQLEVPIGEGMSGTVWRARRPGPLARTVALKRAGRQGAEDRSAARDRLHAEATLLADLDHPHIVDVLDVLDDGDDVAIAMQLAQGGSLRALLDERQTLPAGQLVAVVAPVADALASAHRRGLVHGDVKPANILFTRDGEPLLSDFGAARHFGHPVAPGASVTGTAPYLDPELLDGVAPGSSNDVYSLGVVCYEVLVGALPHGGSTEELLAAADRGDHHPLTETPRVPRPVANLVERAISRRAHDRPSGMEEFAEELRRSVDQASVQLPGVASIGRGAMELATTTDGRPGDPGSEEVGRHGTRMFGPRPLKPAVADEQRGRRSAVGAVFLCILALALGGAVWLRRGHDDQSKSRTAIVPTSRSVPCHAFPKLDAARRVKRFKVDLNGDGCPVPVAWDGQVLSARFDPNEGSPRYYEIGTQGDVLLFGDWDCNGAETPALYRSGAGEVVYVNSFAVHVGDKTYAERIVRHLPRRGTARVVRATDGCQTVRIGGA